MIRIVNIIKFELRSQLQKKLNEIHYIYSIHIDVNILLTLRSIDAKMCAPKLSYHLGHN